MTDLRATEAEAVPTAGPSTRAQGVTITGLAKAFGAQPVLRGVDIEIPRGSVTAVLGSSGSGKTTLLRMLAGFERPDAGTITIGGSLMNGPGCHVAPQDRHVGYVPQEGCLFPHLDVAGTVGFGLPRARRKDRVPEMLELTGLSELADRYPHQLSGGQQQRVALARALAIEPSVLLLDEPLSALDAKVRLQLREQIRSLQQRLHTTTLFVTHDQEEALSMADRVGVMRSGRLEQLAAPSELYAQPATSFVAEFVGTMNRIPGDIEGDGRVSVLGAALPIRGSRPDGPVDVLIRPEELRIAAAPGGNGIVTMATFLGSLTRISVLLSGDVTVQIDVPSAGSAALAPGTSVNVTVTEAEVLVTGRK